MMVGICRALVLIIFFGFGVVAQAGDGVLEINQACATTGGCFDGDSAGFPVTITAVGSYILTSNLVVPDEDTTAIQVSSATPSTLDMNGFSILGPTDCTGAPSSKTFTCSPLGTGMGIDANGITMTVINGSIIGMGNVGMRSSARSRVENVYVRDTGGFAIITEAGSVVRGNRVWQCGGGIDANSGAVSQNTVSIIGGNGIVASGIVSENRVINVAGVGIDISTGVVRNNEVAFATGLGLDGTANVAYEGNVFRDNNGSDANPQVDANSQQTGTNICGTNTTCP